MLPPAIAEEPVIAARDQLGPFLEHDAVGRLDRDPLVDHGGLDVLAVLATHPVGPVNLIPHLEQLEWLVTTVRHEDRGSTARAEHASVRTAAIRVDRPPERHPRR